MPILSIIVPVYNVEEYLDNCIQSILHQTYQDWELILVDDGSTDNCPNICDKYTALDHRITTIHKQNGGLSSARNAGIDIANGDYITFIDSDDDIAPNTYSENIAILEANPKIELLVYPMILDYNNERKRKNNEKKILLEDKREIFLAWYNHNPIDKSSCTKIFRRDIIKPYRYPVGHVHEDFFFFLNLIPKLNCIQISNQGEYHYYSREGSILHTSNLQKDKDWVDAELEMLRQMYQYPEIGHKYLSRYMSTARYLMNITLKFPDANILSQLSHLKRDRPPFRCIIYNEQRIQDIFWYILLRTLGVQSFYYFYRTLLKWR